LGLLSAGALSSLFNAGAAHASESAVSGLLGLPEIAADGTFDTEERFFSRFSRLLLIQPRHRYVTASQKGSMPLPVLQAFKQGLNQIAKDPFPVYLEPSATTREKIAAGYGARVDEIAICRNTTDGVSLILHGIDWQAGDEILTSTVEYPNCVATLLRVASRFGLTIQQFGVPLQPTATLDELLASIQPQIRPGKTRVLFFSAIAQPCGLVMPLRSIAELAQEFGIITVVDGAHYGGMFNPKLDETGIDFCAMAGHKWQCGPGGTGILYARNAKLPANPSEPPRFHLLRSGNLDGPMDGSRPATFDIGAALSLYGFPEAADWRALGQVCQLWDRVGRDRFQGYILSLADYARGRLAEVFGPDCFLQPVHDPSLKSGIVAFNPFQEPSERKDYALASRFQQLMFNDHQYHVGMGGLGAQGLTRPPDPDAAVFYTGCIPNRNLETNAPAPTDIPIRFATGFWLTRRDIDRFILACIRVAEKALKNPGLGAREPDFGDPA
jgi:selenocysteine lyase/cysteine desulfurase